MVEQIGNRLFFAIPTTVGGSCSSVTYPGFAGSAFFQQYNTSVGNYAIANIFYVPIYGFGTVTLFVRVNDDARLKVNGTTVYTGSSPASCRLISVDVTSNVIFDSINTISIEVGEFGSPPSWLYEAWVEGTSIEARSTFGKVFHYIDLLDSTSNFPLSNVNVSVTMFCKDDSGNIIYQHTYPTVSTDSTGEYNVDVSSNPFSIFELSFYRYSLRNLLGLPTWTRARADFSTLCGVTGFIETNWLPTNGQMFDGFLETTINETVNVKDSITSANVSNANISMYQHLRTAPTQLTDGSGNATFSIYPEPVTYNIQKSGYKIATPIFDETGVSTNVCTKTRNTTIVPLPAINAEFISFANKESYGGYYPDDTLQLNYNVGILVSTGNYRSGSYIKIFDPSNTLVFTSDSIQPPSHPYYSPPTINFTASTSIYGLFKAALYDSGNTEYANDSVNFGTFGSLGYDTSNVCEQSKLTITWSSIDPVTRTLANPNMRIKLYDGNGTQKGSPSTLSVVTGTGIVGPNNIAPTSTSGSFTYTIQPADDLTEQWSATLTDQWGHVIKQISISIVGCNQTLFGRVTDINSTPISGATITIDLTGLGFGTHTGTSDSNGNYTITNFQPFTNQNVTCSKTGYATSTVNISVSSGEIKQQDFVLDTILSGTVSDSEGNPIDKTTVWIYGTNFITYTNDQGKYNLFVGSTGTYTVNAVKNNFNISSSSTTISDFVTPVTKNFTLTRKTLESYTTNAPTTSLVNETAGIQLDNISDNPSSGVEDIHISTSGQTIALADYTNSTKGIDVNILNTGQGIFDVEAKCFPKRNVIQGSTITFYIGGDVWAIKVNDVTSFGGTRQAILEFLKNGVSEDLEVVDPFTNYTFTVAGIIFTINVYEIFIATELPSVTFSFCYGSGAATATFGQTFSQIFNTTFNFNHIAVRLLLGNGGVTPCRINVQLFDTSGYTVSGATITFGVPIFKENIILNPSGGGYIHFYFKTQVSGTYCIRIENEDYGYGNMYIHAKSPSTYSYKTYRNGAEVGYSIENWIYEAPIQNDRYLIRQGAMDVNRQYRTDARSTNLVIIP